MSTHEDGQRKGGRFRRTRRAIGLLSPRLSRLLNWDATERMHEHLSAYFTEAFGSERPETLPVEDPTERFTATVILNGLQEEDLERRQRATRAHFLGYIALAIVAAGGCFGGTIWLDQTGHSPTLFTITTALFVALAMVKGAQAAFFNWILRTRRFGAFRAWIGDPAEWWPR